MRSKHDRQDCNDMMPWIRDNWIKSFIDKSSAPSTYGCVDVGFRRIGIGICAATIYFAVFSVCGADSVWEYRRRFPFLSLPPRWWLFRACFLHDMFSSWNVFFIPRHQFYPGEWFQGRENCCFYSFSAVARDLVERSAFLSTIHVSTAVRQLTFKGNSLGFCYQKSQAGGWGQ